jgi:hypothetical protein
MNKAERKTFQEEIKKTYQEEIKAVEVTLAPWLSAIERLAPDKAEADPAVLAEILGAATQIMNALPHHLNAKVVQAFRKAGFSEEFIAEHLGGYFSGRLPRKE